MRRVRVAVLGCGNVGSYLIKNLIELRELIREKYFVDIEIQKVLVRDAEKPREVEGFKIPRELFTESFSDILEGDPDIVVELIGDYEVSRLYILESLNKGKKVVTANKFVVSLDDEIFANKNVYFDAAVGGGIPIIRTINHAVPDSIYEITGILNGTTNYILSSMEDGLEFSEALERAKKLGYAEPDPSFDINGIDASQKICILSAICFGVRAKYDSILKEGISYIERTDIEIAREFGYAVRGIAMAKKRGISETGEVEGEEKFEIAVYPALLPLDSPLAQVRGNLNAVIIKGRRIGELFLKGQGAGGEPTSISVISDIIEAAKSEYETEKRRMIIPPHGKIIEPDEIISKFFVRFHVVDKPGVLAKIADNFGRNNVSIESVLQKGREKKKGEGVPIYIITHECPEKNLKMALEECSKLDVVLGTPFYLRIYSPS